MRAPSVAAMATALAASPAAASSQTKAAAAQSTPATGATRPAAVSAAASAVQPRLVLGMGAAGPARQVWLRARLRGGHALAQAVDRRPHHLV